jgi:hypothetical protein
LNQRVLARPAHHVPPDVRGQRCNHPTCFSVEKRVYHEFSGRTPTTERQRRRARSWEAGVQRLYNVITNSFMQAGYFERTIDATSERKETSRQGEIEMKCDPLRRAGLLAGGIARHRPRCSRRRSAPRKNRSTADPERAGELCYGYF